MYQLLREYCEKSTLHGLHYVIAPRRPLIERITWLLLLICGTLATIEQLIETWQLYRDGPVQVVVQNPRYDLYQIDFPAVTVCSVNKVNAVKANMIFERMFGNRSDETNRTAFLNSLMALSLLRYPYYHHAGIFMRNNVNSTFYEFKNEDIIRIMKEVNPTVDELFIECYWRGILYKCSEIFRRQLTEEGFCYSFNSRTAIMEPVSDITPPFKGKDDNWEVLRNNAAGKTTGIELFMNYPKAEHRLPQDDFRPEGYSIMVHSPNDYPDSSYNVLVVRKPKQVYRIEVTVSTTIADSSISHISKDSLMCKYTENNVNHSTFGSYCFYQCRALYLHKQCNCFPYFFELEISKNNICGIQDVECLMMNNVAQRTPTAPFGETGFPAWSMPDYMSCPCSYSCSYVSYDTELSIAHPIGAALKEAYPKYFAYIDVSYKHGSAIRYNMEARFGILDFFVSLGGLASLLLGCSLISVIEILYYLGRYVYEVYTYQMAKLHPYIP